MYNFYYLESVMRKVLALEPKVSALILTCKMEITIPALAISLTYTKVNDYYSNKIVNLYTTEIYCSGFNVKFKVAHQFAKLVSKYSKFILNRISYLCILFLLSHIIVLSSITMNKMVNNNFCSIC